MSNIIHKVKDTLSHNGGHSSSHTTGNTYDSSKSSNYGPHDSNVANTADPRVDSDHSRAHHATTGTTGLTGGTYDSNRSSNYGPHDSNVANAADPRVDSDRSRASHHQTHPTATSGTTGLTGNTYDSSRSTNYGPHDSNVANAADPRVNSDRSSYNTAGAYNTTGSTYGSNTHGANAYNSGLSSNYGPHNSNVANAADPRVDSDRSGASATRGSTGGILQHASTSSPATGPASSTAGPHKSNVTNQADPRVDSDLSKANEGRFARDVNKSSLGGAGVMHLSGSGDGAPTSTKTFEQAQEAGAGSSYASKKTAGPHKSDTANKLDPRVDSDLDGSKTIGSQRA